MCKPRGVTLRMRTVLAQVQRSPSLIAALTGDRTRSAVLTPDSGPSQIFGGIPSPKMAFFSPTMDLNRAKT